MSAKQQLYMFITIICLGGILAGGYIVYTKSKKDN